MIVSSKFTWGLAWTGLAVILAVPSADFLTGIASGGKSAAVVTSTTEPITAGSTAPTRTASVTKSGVIITPAGSTPPAPANPVDKFLQTNKTLPSYVTEANPSSTAADDVNSKTAAIDPALSDTAPVPFPARPVELIKPIKPKPATAPVLIVDDTTTASVGASSAQSTVAATDPIVPAEVVDDSANWRSQGLGSYLERNGLISDQAGDTSTAAVTITTTDSYDPDGFFLSDGPNGTRAQRRARVLETFGDDPNAPVPPASFNLF